MLQSFIGLFMSDYLSKLKEDLFNVSDDLIKENIIAVIIWIR